jgi:hypothetical protein
MLAIGLQNGEDGINWGFGALVYVFFFSCDTKALFGV